MRLIFKYTLLLILTFVTSAEVCAQKLLSPEEFLGYPYGSRFTFHHRVVDYVKYLCDNSPYLEYSSYGESNEGRPLLLVKASSPENLANAEQIRSNNLKLAGFMEGKPDAKPMAITWLNFNIHGNESASTTAVMPFLYELATQSRPEINNWLKETLVLIDPCVNPDGYARYVNWYQQQMSLSPNADPRAREHDEPWPGGRFNHYLFDLNRDWAWQTQLENQLRVAQYQKWMPQVHVDFHEMGYNSSYFFGPAARPIHEDVNKWQREYQQITADNHKKYFDKEGWLYFTQEVYDLFYPSYGDTYPMFNGAVGFTYEQAGSGRAGVQIARYSADTLTIIDRYTHHLTTALSTVEVVYQQREKLLAEFENYFETARKQPTGTYKSYLIKGNQNQEKIKKLLTLLDKQQIKYGNPQNVGQNYQGFEYFQQKKETVKVEENDILVSVYQNQSTLIKVLFEPESKLEDSLTYDLTAWALPYAYGLKTYAITEKMDMKNGEVKFATQQNKATQNEMPTAYLLSWNSLSNGKFLQQTLQQGFSVRLAEEAFTIENTDYSAGTLIFLREQKESEWSSKLSQLAQKHSQNLQPVYTAQVSKGKDLGSEVNRILTFPKIALFMDKGVATTEAGSIWFFLEQEMKFPMTLINERQLRNISVENYEVLILPSGDYDEYKNALTDYVSAGGKVIAVDEAMEAFVDNKVLDLKEKKPKDSTKTVDGVLKKYEDKDRENISTRLAGAIYQVDLDLSHPISFGIESPFFVIKQNTKSYSFLSGNNWNVGTYPTKNACVSGFAGAAVKPKLTQSLAIGVENYKRGQIVYFTDNPVFRGFWENGKLIFVNAILF